jgi:serine/threonine protein kinase
MDKFKRSPRAPAPSIETARRVSRGGASDVSNVSFKRLSTVRGSVDAPAAALSPMSLELAICKADHRVAVLEEQYAAMEGTAGPDDDAAAAEWLECSPPLLCNSHWSSEEEEDQWSCHWSEEEDQMDDDPAGPRRLEPPGTPPLNGRHGPDGLHEDGCILRNDRTGEEYVQHQRLGTGSYGECVLLRERGGTQVWAGKLCPKKPLSAAKIRRLAKLPEEGKLALFGVEQEVAIHQQLRHLNIVEFREWFCDHRSGRLCSVLEFCSLGTLRAAAARFPGRALPLEAARMCTRQLALGLAYLHATGVSHRDLNPDNLLLDQKAAIGSLLIQQNVVLKIADFGLASHLTPDGRAIGIHGAEVIQTGRGTVNYMAPEIVVGYAANLAPDLRPVDVWAAGIVLHEVLTGAVPFPFEAEDPRQARPAYASLASARGLSAGATAAADLVAQTLQRDPLLRPTAEGLLSHPFLMGPADGVAVYEGYEAAVRGQEGAWHPESGAPMLPPSPGHVASWGWLPKPLPMLPPSPEGRPQGSIEMPALFLAEPSPPLAGLALMPANAVAVGWAVGSVCQLDPLQDQRWILAVASVLERRRRRQEELERPDHSSGSGREDTDDGFMLLSPGFSSLMGSPPHEGWDDTSARLDRSRRTHDY